MAIKDNTISKFKDDRNENIFIGLKYPPHRSQSDSSGFFAGTSTTDETIKNNLICLLKTERGERIMQPTFGIPWKSFLFEHLNQDLIDEVTATISDSISVWLPFVKVENIKLIPAGIQSDHETVNLNSTMKLEVFFRITSDPTTLQSVGTIVTGGTS